MPSDIGAQSNIARNEQSRWLDFRGALHVLGDQADLWVGQSPISRTGEEYPPAAGQLRIGEFVCGAIAALGRDVGNVCPGAGSGRSDGRWIP